MRYLEYFPFLSTHNMRIPGVPHFMYGLQTEYLPLHLLSKLKLMCLDPFMALPTLQTVRLPELVFPLRSFLQYKLT